jgi:hypothetical protein
MAPADPLRHEKLISEKRNTTQRQLKQIFFNCTKSLSLDEKASGLQLRQFQDAGSRYRQAVQPLQFPVHFIFEMRSVLGDISIQSRGFLRHILACPVL